MIDCRNTLYISHLSVVTVCTLLRQQIIFFLSAPLSFTFGNGHQARWRQVLTSHQSSLYVILAGSINVVWFIWCSRNKLRFDNTKLPLTTIKSGIMSTTSLAGTFSKGSAHSLHDFIILRSLFIRIHACKVKDPIEIFWKPPSPGWIKINVDGLLLVGA